MQPADVKLRFCFPKRERISSKLTFHTLLQKNQTLFIFPFKVYINEAPNEQTFDSMAVAVPKRYFKHAVTRNHIKRIIREVYRLNHPLIRHKENPTSLSFYNILFVYISKKELIYKEIEQSVCEILKKILVPS
jgi:ribonuclease P protein component